jgi:hypothetical protein
MLRRWLLWTVFFDIVLESGLTGCMGAVARSVKGIVRKEVTTALVNGG